MTWFIIFVVALSIVQGYSNFVKIIDGQGKVEFVVLRFVYQVVVSVWGLILLWIV